MFLDPAGQKHDRFPRRHSGCHQYNHVRFASSEEHWEPKEDVGEDLAPLKVVRSVPQVMFLVAS